MWNICLFQHSWQRHTSVRGINIIGCVVMVWCSKNMLPVWPSYSFSSQSWLLLFLNMTLLPLSKSGVSWQKVINVFVIMCDSLYVSDDLLLKSTQLLVLPIVSYYLNDQICVTKRLMKWIPWFYGDKIRSSFLFYSDNYIEMLRTLVVWVWLS